MAPHPDTFSGLDTSAGGNRFSITGISIWPIAVWLSPRPKGGPHDLQQLAGLSGKRCLFPSEATRQCAGFRQGPQPTARAILDLGDRAHRPTRQNVGPEADPVTDKPEWADADLPDAPEDEDLPGPRVLVFLAVVIVVALGIAGYIAVKWT
jgi:hypothetical protein